MKKKVSVLLSVLMVVSMLVAAVPVVSAAPPAQGKGQDYVVVKDDWLSKLADKYLGNQLSYPAIVGVTNQKAATDSSYAKIANADQIEVGWKIYIPSAEEAKTYMTTYALPPTEPVELRVAWWGSQTRHDRTIKVIELFQKKYPNIKVSYEFALWDDYWVKMNTQAAGNNLPDVMQQDYQKIAEWVSKGLLMPLDPYVDSMARSISETCRRRRSRAACWTARITASASATTRSASRWTWMPSTRPACPCPPTNGPGQISKDAAMTIHE